MADCICVRRGDGPEGCGICNETGTTPDIAGLCERLRETRSVWSEAKEASIKRRRNPDGPEAADTIERQAAEIERLREALQSLIDNLASINGLAQLATKAAIEDLQVRAALTGEDT
jgi:uncharacterized Zn finger protein (UPF0148 family)